MHISLAPMEGVVDYPMRRLLTDLGGYDRCVTEFVRVTDCLLPDRVFLRYCPELETGSQTRSGVPVYLQLLGSDPSAMAQNAQKAARMGAAGVDLNFGCPAKTVNRSNGGSVLLKEPDAVISVVKAVRDAVDPAVPVTVKMRLGYENDENFEAVTEGVLAIGVDGLCVHARTKVQGYKPPAYWSRVGDLERRGATSKLTINGEIWTPDDARNALIESGFDQVMLGRSALACPDLGLQVKSAFSGGHYQVLAWPEIFRLVETQFARSEKSNIRYIGNRTKQWLVYLKRTYPEAALLFDRIKRLHDEEGFASAFEQHRRMLEQLSAGCEPQVEGFEAAIAADSNQPREHEVSHIT